MDGGMVLDPSGCWGFEEESAVRLLLLLFCILFLGIDVRCRYVDLVAVSVWYA